MQATLCLVELIYLKQEKPTLPRVAKKLLSYYLKLLLLHTQITVILKLTSKAGVNLSPKNSTLVKCFKLFRVAIAWAISMKSSGNLS